MSLTGWVARCDVDGCNHDAYWSGAPPMHRVDCPAHPVDWRPRPFNDPDPARPPALKETA